jgi:hypothetical protein
MYIMLFDHVIELMLLFFAEKIIITLNEGFPHAAFVLLSFGTI